MCDNDSYTKVSIVRKLLEKKIDKIHENLNERLKVLNEELDNFEEVFAKESEKDETELNKLTQYRLHTIELFDDGDYQLTKIEKRIELLKTRIEQRKLKLEFDDDLLNIQISSLGQLVRMERVSGAGYEVFGSVSEGLDGGNYEVIDEELMQEMVKLNRDTRTMSLPTSPSGDKIIYDDPNEDYLVPRPMPRKPLRPAPVAPIKAPPPPPRDHPPQDPPPQDPHTQDSPPREPLTRDLPSRIMSPRLNFKRWKSRSDEYAEIDDKSQEEDMYCRVPDKEKGFFRKKSSSANKLDKIGVSAQVEFHVVSKCRIGAGPGQMLKPKNIAISQKTGCIFVAEKGNNRVQVFASTGEPVYSFTRKTVMPNHSMVKPYGICILNEKVFVSVTQHNCVHAYKSNGEFIAQKGQEGKGDGNFVFPTGMSTDGTNRVYVCDYGNNRVQAFSKELQFKQVIGVGNLTNPTDIAVDQHLDLYVLDRATTVVHIFNSKGVYQKKIIKIIKYPILSNPQFIAISPKGRIVLSDLLSNSVNIFTMDGGLRQTLGGPRDKELFGEPRGVAFDRNGNLVVACHKETGCLQIIEIDI